MSGPLLRPIGFRPWEISAMINQEVIDQHGEEAAFLWTQRDHATTAPQYALKDLAKLDERVEAHADGLRVARDAGWTTALANLAEGPGEVFAASVLAFESGDAERVGAALGVGCAASRLERGLISALGWIEQDVAMREARKLLESPESEVRRAGIAGMAVHRVDPGPPLAAAIENPDPRLAARAMRAVAELGRRDLLPEVLARLADTDANSKFWAAWSAVRLGERHASNAMAVLIAEIETGGPLATRAMDMALRVMTVEDGHALWRELMREPAKSRLAVIAAGIIGDPATVPELIAQMENPELARAAGRSFSMITGADFGYEGLEGDAPHSSDADEDETLLFGPDADLPWPLPAAIHKWGTRRAAGYVAGVRYLLSKPMIEQSLLEALVKGRQNQRAAAALELAVRNPSQILFETRDRARRQQKKVAAWSS
jgi:uncharacterized protein (TIGR02270 family)